MIETSKIVDKTFENLVRRIDAKILVDGVEIENSIMSIQFNKGACGQFNIGTIYVPYIELVLDGVVEINEEFELQMSIAVQGEFSEYYTIGYFKATSHEKKITQTNIYAQGKIAELVSKTLYEDEPTARSLLDILTAIERKGYEIRNVNNLEIPDATIPETTPMIGMTCREALELVVTCCGGYATEDNIGRIAIAKFAPSETVFETFGDKCTQEPMIKGNYELTGVRVVVGEDNEFEIGDEVNLEIRNPYFTEDMVPAFNRNAIGYSFTVSSIPLSLGDFRLEPWDCIAYREGEPPLYPKDDLVPHNNLNPGEFLLPNVPELGESLVPDDYLYPSNGTGIVYLIPCLSMSFTFNGGLQTNIESDADLPDELSTRTGGPMTAKIEEAYEKAMKASGFVEECEEGTADVNGECITSGIPQLSSKITSIGDPDSDHISIDDSLISIYGTETRFTMGSGKLLVEYNDEKILVLRAENSTEATYIDSGKIVPGDSKEITIPDGTILNIRADIQLQETIGSAKSEKYATSLPWHGITYGTSNGKIAITNNYDGRYSKYGYAVVNQIYITVSEIGNLMEIGDGKFVVDHDGNIISLPTVESPVANTPNLYIDEDGRISKVVTNSSRLIKKNIDELKDKSLEANNLLNLKVVQYQYRDGILSENDARNGELLPGFIVEDLADKYPVCVDKETDNPKTWTWNERYLIPGIIKLLQTQQEEIEKLKNELKERKEICHTK